MKYSIFGIAFACLVAASYAATFTDCGSKTGKFTKIEIAGCKEETKYCILKRGSNATISVEFVSNLVTSSVKALVWGRIADLDVPFPLPNPDGCTSGVKCPIQPNTPNTYVATLPVLKIYPKLQLIVKWELIDAEKNVVVCALIPAQIR